MAEVTTPAYTPLQQQSTAAAAAAAVSAAEPSSKKARKAAAKEAALHEAAAAAAAPSPTAAATSTKKSKRKRDDPHATLLADIPSPVANGSAPAAQQASRPMGLRAVGWGDEEDEVDPREAAAAAAVAAAEAPAAAEPVSKSKRKRQKAQQEAEVRAAELKRMEVSGCFALNNTDPAHAINTSDVRRMTGQIARVRDQSRSAWAQWPQTHHEVWE